MEVEHQAVLAHFQLSYSATSARWYPILSDVKNNLSSFLGLDYNLRYIPLLCKCRLVKKKSSSIGKKSYILCQMTIQKGGYYELTNFSIKQYNYTKQYNKQIYFLRIGVLRRILLFPLININKIYHFHAKKG
jgi:hypothetical protein